MNALRTGLVAMAAAAFFFSSSGHGAWAKEEVGEVSALVQMGKLFGDLESIL
ncbi:MAG: hypothetical protein R6X27_08550 [Candidatus Desulfacyla sp.]